MLLRDVGEFGFIERIARRARARATEDPRVVVGIGDDAALLDLGGPELLAVTTDAMLEGQHFRLDWLAPEQIGERATSGALSDLAAMGAEPVAVFGTVGLPPDWPVEGADALMDGIAQAASAVGATLAGGDVTASARVLVDLTAVGTVPRGEQLLRSGARPGQVLAVTGALGGAAAAVALLSVAGPEALADFPALAQRFAHPEPRVRTGRAIAAAGLASAAIDISDGPAQDAGHIAERSGVRAVIEAARVPIAEGCAQVARRIGGDALTYALAGGEDFELLLALDEDRLPALQALEAVAEVGLTMVGRVEEGVGVVVLDADGQEIDLPRGGWDHFA